MSTYVDVVISPATTTRPVVIRVSQATRPIGSSRRTASRTASEIWSAILSGCPSVTDSEVKRKSREAIRGRLAHLQQRAELRHRVRGRSVDQKALQGSEILGDLGGKWLARELRDALERRHGVLHVHEEEAAGLVGHVGGA